MTSKQKKNERAALLDALEARLSRLAAARGVMPGNESLARELHVTTHRVRTLLEALQRDGRIRVECRGHLRRVKVGGRWTRWPDDGSPIGGDHAEGCAAVLALLTAAAAAGAPCPSDAFLGDAVDVTERRAGDLVHRLARVGKIIIERRGGGRRISVDGVWTAWTGLFGVRSVSPVWLRPDPGKDLVDAKVLLQRRGVVVYAAGGDRWRVGCQVLDSAGLLARAALLQRQISPPGGVGAA